METGRKQPLYVYYCGKEACEPGHFFGPAIRPHYLIHFIISGSGIYKTGKDEYRLNAGDAFLIRPGDTTFYQADREEPWVYGWAAFDGTEAEVLLLQCGFSDSNLIYRGEICEKRNDLTEQLAARFNSVDYNQLELRGFLYLIFSLMEKEQPAADSVHQREYVSKACDYMRDNFRYHMKIADIARYIGIDRTYLYKVFMSEKGKSPQQYLMDKRLNEARNLLQHTSLNVTEIAYSSGFHDAPSFCRYFKLAEKCTPLQYRSRNGY